MTLSASQSQVKPNDAVTPRWSSSHADRCIAIGDRAGTRRFSGTQTISNLEKNSEFILKCAGVGGPGTDSVNITVMDSGLRSNTGIAVLTGQTD